VKRLVLALVFVSAALGQTKPDDELVTVPKKYVSSQGLANAVTQDKLTQATSWAGVGKEVGEATREALNSVVDVSDKFGKTDVGRFVMIMVAWRIIGKDAVKIVFGIPIFLAGVGVWFYIMRKFFFPQRILIKDDKATKTKEWKTIQFEWRNGESKASTALLFAVTIVGWCIAMLTTIFA
jgi:hypothetical protein